MDNLGNYNLFTSVIINGANQKINETINKNCIINKLLKDSNNKQNYKIQYVINSSFIEKNTLKKVLKDLVILYKKEYPYSSKEDFEAHVLSYSKYFMEEVINRDFRLLTPPLYLPKELSIYTYFHPVDKEYIALIIPSDNSVSHFKQYFKMIIQLINELEYSNDKKLIDHKTQELDTNTKQKNKNSYASLPELIRNDKSEEFANKIKEKYKGIKGKELKFLFIALQELELIPKNGFAKKFHEGCKLFFDGGVGSYQAMNDYEINEFYDRTEIEEKIEFIKSLI